MKSQHLYEQAKRIIPGGTQLLSKRPEMFLPDFWPAYYSKAKGVQITDLDGRSFVDMSIMGVGACILGYSDPDVDDAVREAVANGSMSTLNAPEEVELASLLCELHPWAEMVRYARSGAEGMSVAVRIARAHTGKDKVAFCGYHGWSDWYLAANLANGTALESHLLPGLDPRGVPSQLKGSALPFHYNRIDELQAIVESDRSDLAAIVMEPQRGEAPRGAFLEEIRQIATEIGSVLIFDEITTGFRAATGGIHLNLGVEPDLAVFAKAMANGYAMAAIIGSRHVMESAQTTFISSTNWTERIGPAAALATIRKLQRENVTHYITTIGEKVLEGWQRLAKKHGLAVTASGLPCLTHFLFDHPEELSLTTAFTQLMLDRGYLAYNQFKPSFAHGEVHVHNYLSAVDDVFSALRDAAQEGRIKHLLKGPEARRGFYRLT
jgi:glutamate-1-semialdehyde aminotransferase